MDNKPLKWYEVGLTPFERLVYWIREREQIRVKRARGLPRPWTDDPILQSYRFCNVVRMDDKVSQWLLDNWYGPHHDHPNMLLACAMARQFNHPDTLEALGFPLREWDGEAALEILRDRVKRRLNCYNGAYVISNMGSKEPKIELTVNRVLTPIWQWMQAGGAVYPDSMQATWKALCDFEGVGSFIGGQITADLRWAMLGEWADRMKWAPSGPGSIRGLLRLDDVKPRKNMPANQFRRRFDYWLDRVLKLKHIPDRMEAMDFQNCLCEFDKYERCLHGEGKPKQHYNGVNGIKRLS